MFYICIFEKFRSIIIHNPTATLIVLILDTIYEAFRIITLKEHNSHSYFFVLNL